MFPSLRDYCNACRKVKWFVRQRRYNLSKVKGPITSEGKLCGKCAKGVKKLVSTIK